MIPLRLPLVCQQIAKRLSDNQTSDMQKNRHQTGNLKSSLSDNRPEAFAASFQTSEGEHQHAFPYSHIEESTIPRRSSVPLSFKKGAAFCKIPLSQLLHSCLFIREHSTSLLQSAKIAPSRTLGLPAYERSAFIPPPQISNLPLICSSFFMLHQKRTSKHFCF